MTQTIVIIDDSADIHRLARSAFAPESWNLQSAYSGSDGLVMATSQCADLVLLDVDLPDINGFDVCRHLKAHPNTSCTSVIFLTAASSSDEKNCGLELQAADYVTKPFDPAELRVRVRNALRTKKLLDLIPKCVMDFQSMEASGSACGHT